MSNQQGTVKFFKESAGWGFVAPDAGGDDVFVHISQCDQNIDTLVQGQRVEFTLGLSNKGKTEAKSVRLI
jgi:CspA family cold shock protein